MKTRFTLFSYESELVKNAIPPMYNCNLGPSVHSKVIAMLVVSFRVQNSDFGTVKCLLENFVLK